MRIGKPGKWWVLRYADSPIFWTGAMEVTEIHGAPACVAVFSIEALAAQQFKDRGTAVFAHSIFGLSRDVVAAEMTFASGEDA
jgi:hypothetical protein